MPLDPFEILPPRGANQRKFARFVKRERKLHHAICRARAAYIGGLVPAVADLLMDQFTIPELQRIFGENSILDEIRDEVTMRLAAPAPDWRTLKQKRDHADQVVAARQHLQAFKSAHPPKQQLVKIGDTWWPKSMAERQGS